MSTFSKLHREIVDRIEELEDTTLDPRAVSPLDRARQRRKQKASKSSTAKLGPPEPQTVVRDGVRFDPANLDTPYAVAQVLNQEPGKLKAKDLRDGQ